MCFQNRLEKPFIILAEKNMVHYIILCGIERNRIFYCQWKLRSHKMADKKQASVVSMWGGWSLHAKAICVGIFVLSRELAQSWKLWRANCEGCDNPLFPSIQRKIWYKLERFCSRLRTWTHHHLSLPFRKSLGMGPFT